MSFCLCSTRLILTVRLFHCYVDKLLTPEKMGEPGDVRLNVVILRLNVQAVRLSVVILRLNVVMLMTCLGDRSLSKLVRSCLNVASTAIA